MKIKLIFSVMAVMFFAADLYGARSNPNVTGTVFNEREEAMEYVTVTLIGTDDATNVVGGTTNSKGKFLLTIPEGDYHIKIYYLGYGNIETRLYIDGDVDLGEIVMEPATNQLEAVTVASRPITREADRFVVNIANNPVAVGKDAFDMLKASPGVWISGSDITINGRSGTRVMINDRTVRMSGDELEAYLRSINAEDIVRIEIIPDSGAEYDADSGGGIIKITMTKQRDEGIDGSAAVMAQQGYYGSQSLAPTININYKSGNLNLYANGSYNYSKNYIKGEEVTEYGGTSSTPGVITSSTPMDSKTNGYGGKFGAVYDFNAKNSVGAEVNAFLSSTVSDQTAETSAEFPNGVPLNNEGSINYYKALTNSSYNTTRDNTHLSGTMNYIRKIGERGSVFKLIGEYVRSITGNNNYYLDKSWFYDGGGALVFGPAEERKRIGTDADYGLASLSANSDFVLSDRTTIKTGVKYTHNSIYSNQLTERFEAAGGDWAFDPDESSLTDYLEDIAAAYLIYNSKFFDGKLGVSAGLRGEYSIINPRYTKQNNGQTDEQTIRRSYFDLFPNVNLSAPLNESRSNSIVLAYSRNIMRPNFSLLTPFRTPMSPYSEIVGNPDLKAMYFNNFSLTGIFAYKYSVTAGAVLMQNQITQMVIKDGSADDGDLRLLYQYVNLPRTWQYYVALNAPVTFTDWWTGSFNLVGGDIRQQLVEGGRVNRRPFAQVFANMVFSLPKGFNIEISGWGMTTILNANMEVYPMGNVNMGVKKNFAKNKFTASLGVNNLIDNPQKVRSYGEGFNKTMTVNYGNFLQVNMSLRYNFKSGVSFRAKQVEKASDEDAKRMTEKE